MIAFVGGKAKLKKKKTPNPGAVSGATQSVPAQQILFAAGRR